MSHDYTLRRHDSDEQQRSLHDRAPGKRTLTSGLQAGRQSTAGNVPDGRQAEGAVQRLSEPERPESLVPHPVDDPFGLHLLGATSGIVQCRDDGPAPDAAVVHAAAARGLAGPTSKLPFADRIQSSFGATADVSRIRAHISSPAADACGDMRAAAYATGDHVVFSRPPDLHTAAHEAAHVVQQSRGVHLPGGVGTTGDAYERHADAVADRVVAGRSAADLLSAEPTAASTSDTAVQRKPRAKSRMTPAQRKREKQHRDNLRGRFDKNGGVWKVKGADAKRKVPPFVAVTTYNVNATTRYNAPDRQDERRDHLAAVKSALGGTVNDIILLQELQDGEAGLDYALELGLTFKMNVVYDNRLAILSPFKISGKEKVPFAARARNRKKPSKRSSARQSMLLADVKVGSKKLKIVNTHLDSSGKPAFGEPPRGETAKEKQLRAFLAKLAELKADPKVAGLVAGGDLNIGLGRMANATDPNHAPPDPTPGGARRPQDRQRDIMQWLAALGVEAGHGVDSLFGIGGLVERFEHVYAHVGVTKRNLGNPSAEKNRDPNRKPNWSGTATRNDKSDNKDQFPYDRHRPVTAFVVLDEA